MECITQSVGDQGSWWWVDTIIERVILVREAEEEKKIYDENRKQARARILLAGGGFRGESYMEAGYIFAPYIPILKTPEVLVDVSTMSDKMKSRYAKKKINNNFYGRVRVNTTGNNEA